MALFEPIFAALNRSGARYVVVGGMAVVLHGHARLTADLDIVLDLEPSAARNAVEALVKAGLKARIPEDPAGLANPARRKVWIEEKGMQVLTLTDPANPLLSVDLFVREPMPFDALWSRSEPLDVGGIEIRVAGIDDLIAMKSAVGRPQDREDVAALEAIKRERHG